VEPAVVSLWRSRGASRATSAIWTPFQLETVTPAMPARIAIEVNGQIATREPERERACSRRDGHGSQSQKTRSEAIGDLAEEYPPEDARRLHQGKS
jgi:hypothetical protein